MANSHSIDLELSSSQYLTASDSVSLRITGDITLEAWVKLEQLPSTIGDFVIILGKWTSTAGNRAYFFGFDSTDKLTARYSSTGSEQTYDTTDSAIVVGGDVGVWIHFAVTMDVSAQDIKIYKNASLVASTLTGTGGAIFETDESLGIGCLHADTTPTFFMDGLIDEVRIWNDVRTPTEISDNYQKELIGNEAGLVAYYKLNDSLLDETANNNDLSNPNSAVFSTDIPNWAAGPVNLLTLNGITKANIKTINGIAIGNVKTWNGIA